MNKFRFLLSALVIGSVFTFSSCSEDDDDVPKKNIVEVAQSNDDFSILVQALTREDLTTDFVAILTGEGPFTVFAPTNAAFVALLGELEVEGLNDIPAATLEAVLKYHVVSGAAVKAGDLTEGQVVTTVLSGTFTIGLEGGAKITDANGRVSNIVITDVEASNGVIHAIDKVILPAM
jgi:transforming growth factor-beta-induced protein